MTLPVCVILSWTCASTRKPNCKAKLNSFLSGGQQIQALFNETAGTGLQAPMTAFFNSLTQLSASPSDVTVRQNVVTTAQNLAQAFSQSSNNLTTLQRTTNLSVQQSVTAINSLTAQIAQVNEQVSAATTAGQNPGAFIDQRQQLINQLSGYIDVASIDAGNGSVTLTTNNGSPLVAAGQSFALSTEANATNGLAGVYSNGSDITSQITGGALAGQIQVRDQEIPTIQNSLDTLAYNFSNAVNTQNAKGVDLNGMVGGNLFVAPTQLTRRGRRHEPGDHRSWQNRCQRRSASGFCRGTTPMPTRCSTCKRNHC